jgi:hypothetical protein
MSSSTNIEGEITISPPIPWPLVKDSRFVVQAGRWCTDTDVQLRVDQESTPTGDGYVTVAYAVAIVVSGRETDGRHVVSEINEILAAFGEGREFGGRLDLTNRDYMTTTRVKVIGTGLVARAAEFEPIVTWPKESE